VPGELDSGNSETLFPIIHIGFLNKNKTHNGPAGVFEQKATVSRRNFLLVPRKLSQSAPQGTFLQVGDVAVLICLAFPVERFNGETEKQAKKLFFRCLLLPNVLPDNRNRRTVA
jgi:hypothetical protein